MTDKVSETPRHQKVVVVLPAYNAEKTLRMTYNDIPKDAVDEIILVDDKSADRTITVARELGIKYFLHEKNLGYGGNQKTCYKWALDLGADVVVMLHPDYQYDPKHIPEMIEPIKAGHFDMMLGSRFLSRKAVLEGGMPFYKYLANRALTLMQNIIFGRALSEFHTGYRAYSRRVLETIPFLKNSDNYVFDSEFLAQAIYFEFEIGETYVPTRYFPDAHTPNFSKSLEYGLQTLGVAGKYLLAKWRLYTAPIFKKDK
jgi:glycosyltransferase involved in cell wall biosynthesis